MAEEDIIMDMITLSRFLPLVSILIVLLAIKLISPPREVLRIAFMYCWSAGLFNWLVDIPEQHYGFWHYTSEYLAFGIPIDLYFSVSLVVGAALPILYWWVKSFHRKMLMPFLMILPFYFLMQDYILITSTKYAIVIFDSPYWWLADFPSLCVIVYGPIIVFSIALRRRSNEIKSRK